MHGASFAGNHVSRAENALKAGCDLILACNDSIGAISILDNLRAPMADDSVISKLRYSKNRVVLPLHKNPIWVENNQKLRQFAERI